MTENVHRNFSPRRKDGSNRRGWIFLAVLLLAIFGVQRYLAWRGPEHVGPAQKPAAPAPSPTPAPAPEKKTSPASTPPSPPSAQTPVKPKPAKPAPEKIPENASQASTPRAYRQDAAKHLYAQNTARIYKGKLQPLLYAVGVLQVHLDKNGKIKKLYWMRAPRHAPEVIREIERTVRAAAPYPAPIKMGGVIYTDTWLWDKSGKFQLDTLTEGQL